jgi:hypothetical protein
MFIGISIDRRFWLRHTILHVMPVKVSNFYCGVFRELFPAMSRTISGMETG